MDTVCASGGPSNLAVNSSVGSTYQWTVIGANILTGQGSSDILVDWPKTTATVSAFVVETSSDGCIGDTVFAEVFVAEPSTSHITGPTEVCQGEYVELEAFDTKNDGKFLWSNGDTTDVIAFFAKRDTTIYRVAFNDNCEHDTTYHDIKVNPTPLVVVSTDAVSDTINFNSYVNFYYDGNSVGAVDWYLNDLWMSSGVQANILFTQPGWNTVRVIAHTGDCADTLEHRMYVDDEVKVHIPTAFSPNGDGLNDVWTLEGLGFDKYEVAIYDRWGNVMAKWDDQNPGQWDGTYRGNRVTTGAYQYRVRVWTINNHIKDFSGPITLIR